MRKKKSKYNKYKQGKFSPQAKEKYKGSLPVIYRSSWELQLFRWLDRNSSCIRWGSESCVIRYKFRGTVHRYFIDVNATFKTKDGPKKFLIEVKPYRQTIPPVESKRKKAKTLLYEKYEYAKNTAKWIAAKRFAKQRGATFIILTEKELFKDK